MIYDVFHKSKPVKQNSHTSESRLEEPYYVEGMGGDVRVLSPDSCPFQREVRVLEGRLGQPYRFVASALYAYFA